MAINNNTITIERKSAQWRVFTPMHVSIDDITNFYLLDSEIKNIKIPSDKKECTIRTGLFVFKVVNLNQIKKITLKIGYISVECTVLYNDGKIVHVRNNNHTVDKLQKKARWALIIMILFVLIACALYIMVEIPLEEGSSYHTHHTVHHTYRTEFQVW